MAKPKKQTEEQTAKRKPNGQFGEGNTIGNRFGKGESGNPRGRKPSPVTQAINDCEAGDYAKLAKVAWENALAGDKIWARFIAEYGQGKPIATVETFTHEKDELIVIE